MPEKNPISQGIRKAAILVAALDTSQARKLLAQMPPEQAQQVRRAVANLGRVDPEEREKILAEFLRGNPAKGPAPDIRPRKPVAPALKVNSGVELDPELARKLSSGLPEAAAANRTDAKATPRPFGFLQQAEADKVARALSGERPQMIALVLAHLSQEQAGAVLVRFPPQSQVEIVHRLVDLEETQPDVLREVEKALESRLSDHVYTQRRRVAGLSAVSGILSAASPNVSVEILDNLTALDRSLAEKLGPDNVDFADLVEQDDQTLSAILDTADPRVAMTALVGAPPELIDRMLAQLPRREADTLRKRLDHPGPIRLSDVEEARRQLGEIAKRLGMERKVKLRRRRLMAA
jgi:flagellar motor switch protein FliG